jgi:hypothetical protein
MLGRSRLNFESEPDSIPVGAIVETRTAWGGPAAGGPAALFLRANTEPHLVGISVGIRSDRRSKMVSNSISYDIRRLPARGTMRFVEARATFAWQASGDPLGDGKERISVLAP